LNLPIDYIEDLKWQDDHPSLFSEVRFERSSKGYPPPLSLLRDAVRPDGVNWI
jgi:hypothetical protein